MIEMVERVAREIYACQQEGFHTPWAEASGPVQENFIDTARLAIAAMREPTKEMLEAAKPEPVHLFLGRSREDRRSLVMATAIDQMALASSYRDMIDGALK